MRRSCTYRDAQIRVHQHLELEVLLALIANLQGGLQCILGQCNAVHQSKFVRPCLAELLGQHGVRQTEVQLHGEIGLVTILCGRVGGRLAEELPVGVTRKSMLR